MGKPPAAIFIARHGARLDAANKEWHLTSATPYDPPLSYGGWLQSRALGARIISELRSLEHQPDRSAQEAQDPKTQPHRLQERKQKRRIIIHTSPFLRCVQTAIAISSGISQNHAGIDSPHPARIPGLDQSSTATTLPQPISNPRSAPPQGNHRCLLRVDACLGEWLSPNYFENITPPPKSERMVTTAKTELLRRDRSVIPSADTQNTPSVGHFPGGWSNTVTNPVETGSSDVDQASTMANGTGQRNRAGSYDSFGSGGTGWGRKILKINTDLPSVPDTAYTPPIPSYAISTSSPIPDGYVTHARDACVSVDYQWDSMREPQNWGTGGEYGEEWSTMHSRFKTGLERMISWYQDDDPSTAPPRRRSRSQLRFLDQDEAEDSAVNTILILVTHGAGCNALIGAISGGPALVDVNTASLTLAVRKDCLNNTTQDGEEVKQHDSLTKSNGFENYQLVEVASTDHLRPGTSPSTSARSSSISSLPSPSIPSYRHRLASRASFSSGPTTLGLSLKSSTGFQSWTTPRASSGLWNSVSGGRETAEDLVPNFGSPLSASSSPIVSGSADITSTPQSSRPDLAGQIPQRTQSQRGLWGSVPPNRERQATSNRRWTVAERPL